MNKLPYKKLQYPIYIKDTNPNVHIKIFKKAIKTNGEIVEVDIINLFGFTFKDISSNEVKILFKIIQVACLKNWNNFFMNTFES
jgi:hypothetical protein